jgi:hypothetical protein
MGNSSPLCVASSPCGVCIVSRWRFSAGVEWEPRTSQSKGRGAPCAQTFEIKGGSSDELARLMRADAATNAAIVAQADIKAE